MLMKRRNPPTWLETLRVSVWPRRSWLRSGQYVTKRIMRLTATPHAVSAGVAAGALTSFTPFMGLHFILAFVFAWLARGNMIAAALGTFVGNPLTFPFIWAATYNTGHFVLQTSAEAGKDLSVGDAMGEVMKALWAFDGGAAMTALDNIWTPLIYPMFIGGMIIGPLVALPIYFATRRASLMFRESRRDQLMRKATEIQQKAANLAESKKIQNRA